MKNSKWLAAARPIASAISRLALLLGTIAVGAVHAGSVSFSGNPLTQNGGTSSSCTYSSVTETTAGNWSVTCGAGTKTITVTPAVCGTVCNSYSSVSMTTAGNWTVAGCQAASAAASVQLTNPSSYVVIPAGTSYLLQATAIACKPATVQRVEFWATVGTTTTQLGTVAASPYDLPWTPADGTYSVFAKALDSAGIYTNSNAVTLRANAAPTVTASVSPTGTRAAPGAFSLTATATDSDGIASIQWIGTNVSPSPTGGAYSWSAVPAGTYTVYAHATDTLGTSADSAPITVTVSATDVAPTVSVTAPAAGSSPSRPVTLQATAADSDGTVTRVQFVDEASGQVVGTATSGPTYTAQWTNPPAGAHTIHAVATDNSGGQGVSTSVAFTVLNALPSVQVTAPAANSSPTAPVALTAAASDSDGTIAKVEFIDDASSQVIGTVTSAPYTFSWASPALGSHTIHARATDNDGGQTNSAPVTFNVVTTFRIVLSAAPQTPGSYVAPAAMHFAINPIPGMPGISQITLFKDGVSQGTMTAPPAGAPGDWTSNLTLGAGTYKFTAVATATDGSSGYSNEATVVVDASGPPAAPYSCSAEQTSGTIPGATSGSASVADMGAASYSIPIQVPPGIAGVAPSLSLGYSSQGGNGPLGMGWALQGLSVIHRCAKTQFMDNAKVGITYSSADALCMDGQRLVQVPVSTFASDTNPLDANPLAEYRTEHESYSKIQAFNPLDASMWVGPAYFKVWTKSGQILYYGYKASEVSNPYAAPQDAVLRTYPYGAKAESGRIWALYRIEDRFGNYVLVNYDTDNAGGTIRPKNIQYTVHGTNAIANQVVFNYATTRSDAVKLYDSGGLPSYDTDLLSSIVTSADGGAVKSYTLSYAASAATGRNLLQSVKECSGDGLLCLRPTSFAWTDATSGARTFNFPGYYWNGVPNAGRRDSTVAADLNGDGKTDLVSVGDPSSMWQVCTSTGANNFNCGQWYSVPRAQGSSRDDIWHFGDFNGDGKADLVFLSSDGTGVTLQLSTGSGFGATYSAPVAWNGMGDPASNPYSHTIGDFDGDGRTDLALYNGNGYWYFCSFDGSQFSCSPQVFVHEPTNSPNAGFDFLVADLNGDGKADFAYHDNNSSDWFVCYSTSQLRSFSFDCATTTTKAVPENAYQIHVADFNGDGLADLGTPAYTDPDGTSYPNRWQICLSKGDKTFDCSYWYGPTSDHDNSLLGDFNGDGRTDVAWYDGSAPGGWHVCESTGSGFTPSCGTTKYAGGAQVAPGNNLEVVRAGDFNGDGKTDIATLVSDSSGMWSVGISGNVAPADALRQVTNGLGAQTTFTYGPLTDPNVYAKGTAAVYPEIDIQSPMYVVSHLDTSTMSNVAGEPATYGVDYRYSGLKGHALGAGLSGFASRSLSDPVASMCTETDTQTIWDQRQIGVVRSVTKRHGGTPGVGTCSNGTALSALTNTWQSRQSNTWSGLTDAWTSGGYPVWEVFLTASSETHADLDGTAMPSSSMSAALSNIDAYGDPKFVSTSASDGYGTSTSTAYLNQPGNYWVIGKPQQVTVTKTLPYTPVNNNPTRVTNFSYDGNGILKEEIREQGRPGTSQFLRTNYTYDSFGNRDTTITSDLPDGNTAHDRTVITRYCATGSAGYGCSIDGRFPTYLQNSLGQAEIRVYDTRFGTMKQVTGPNSLTTTSSYDKLGRKFCEARPDGSTTGWTWSDDTAPSAYFVASRDSTGAQSKQHFDGLGRKVLMETLAFDGLSWSSVSAGYDGRGRKVSATKPYGDAYGASSYTLDDLNRVISETGPGGYSATYAYQGLKTSVTLGGGYSGPQTTTKTANSRGEVIDVLDARSSHLQLQYDYFGDLERKSVVVGVDGGSPTTTVMYYNAVGQKIGMNDADQGSWTYGYDSWGELTSQTDAQGQQTTFSYDSLGRMYYRVESGIPTQWVYDSVNGVPCGIRSVGKLCQTIGNDATRENQYDALARLASVKQTYNTGRVLQRFTTYDSMSRVREIVYPITGLTLLQDYNASGYLYRIEEPARGIIHWTAQSRYADGQIKVQQLRGGTTTTTYDPLGRPATIQTPNVQNASYTFDALGNLLARADTASNLSESFTYDALNRLKTVWRNGSQVRSYNYDSLGNLIYRSDLGTITYAPNTHKIAQVSGVGYNYDPNGNFQGTADFARTVSYTSFGMVQEVMDYSGSASKGYDYFYDGDHHRSIEFRMIGQGSGASSNSDTYYFYDGVTPFFEEDNDTPVSGGMLITWRQYINTPEGIEEIVTVKNDASNTRTDRTLTRDHLGSTVVAGGDVPAEMLGYDEWGRRRNADGSSNPAATSVNTDRGFTGHEMMDTNTLVNMNGRVYDPVVGRFLQPDPLVQAPQNLQSYNSYSYVLNNPLSLTDPTGYSWWTRNGRPVFRGVVAIVASWVSYGAASSWAASYVWGSAFDAELAAGASVDYASMSAAATLAESTTTIEAVGGAAAGFAAGGIQGGNLQSALYGALSGGITGGLGSWSTTEWNLADNNVLTVDDYKYHREFYLDRAIVKSAIQGVSRGIESRAQGGKFSTGFKRGLLRQVFDDAYEAYVPWEPQVIGPGGPGMIKQDGQMAFYGVDNFGNALTPQNPVGGCWSEGGLCSRIADRSPAMDPTSISHDVFANIFGTHSWETGLPHLCESSHCFSLMVPAAVISYGTLSRWLP